MTQIYLVRHGQTDANKNRIVQGRIDNPLNPEGISQARETGRYFRENDIRFDIVVASPLERAFKTAQLINEEMLTNRPIVVNQGLIERNFGQIDGNKIEKNYQTMIAEGKVKNMEKNAALEKRVIEALQTIVDRFSGKRILVVTHSHVIKALLVQLSGTFTYKMTLNNCSISHLSHRDQRFITHEMNIDPLHKKES